MSAWEFIASHCKSVSITVGAAGVGLFATISASMDGHGFAWHHVILGLVVLGAGALMLILADVLFARQ